MFVLILFKLNCNLLCNCSKISCKIEVPFVGDGEVHLVEEIYDGVLCEATESLNAEINTANKGKEEAETAEKSRFVELSEDDLDVIGLDVLTE